ncbi:hypothetical protein SAMN05444411_1207 [Lutibacter oricola]|uniref:Uncharacterized protein n=1 Tax=Lutibacter oricola TaxID=762486 RepID=A0A1H3GX23_9FLAO|nr:hypothetical protein [Lutibacter oricola]SDY07866.1 hypothetical protein SAMN05444411_1207 [Lutibacter oricola]
MNLSFKYDLDIYIESIKLNNSSYKKNSITREDYATECKETVELIKGIIERECLLYHRSCYSFREFLWILVDEQKLFPESTPEDIAYLGIHWEVTHKNAYTALKLWTKSTTIALMSILKRSTTDENSYYAWELKKRTHQFNDSILSENVKDRFTKRRKDDIQDCLQEIEKLKDDISFHSSTKYNNYKEKVQSLNEQIIIYENNIQKVNKMEAFYKKYTK